MKKPFWPLALGFAGIFAMATVFGAENDAPAEPEDDGVVLGEVDLAERGEILRNQFRRITPCNALLSQDVGTWPAAWEEFGANWNAASAEREYGAWVVPVELTQDNAGATVVRDGAGLELWRGMTDFARPESAGVVLTGGLVAEEDWAAYEAVRGTVESLSAEASRADAPVPVRTVRTNGLRFTAHEWTTNNTFRLGLACEADTNVDVFAFAVAHTSAWVVATWTNDEDVAVTDTNLVWYPAAPPFNGMESHWEWRGTVAIDNGVAEFEDSGFAENLGRLRYYAAAVARDSDGDGLSDGEEAFVSHTNPGNPDSDGDGVDDWTEHAAGSNPTTSNVWWIVTRTNVLHEWVGLGTNIPSVAQFVTNYPVTAVRPATNSVLCDVRVSGYVDDILCVDGNVVAGWDNGPTNFASISVFTTNMQNGTLDLELWDLPSEGYSGENEVKLGWSYENPFRVEWDWKVPIAIRMEPIWSSETLPLDNPSGVILNSNAWFHVDVFPEGVVPEDKIAWTSQSNKLAFVTMNRGARVEIHGQTEGEDALTVSVENAEGDFGLPPFHVQVMPLTVVTARVGVVVSTNGDWAVSPNQVASIIEEANLVLLQTGKQIVMEGNIQPIADMGGFFDVYLASNEVHTLRSQLSQPGGMEIYFVNSIVKVEGGHALGANNPSGMLISAQGTGRTLGHETCHACGAKDIYVFHDGTALTAHGEIREEWMPKDWGTYSVGGMPAPDIDNLIPRLLMYGYTMANSIPPKGDVPSGGVFGLGDWGVPFGWETDLCPGVGLQGLWRAPVHQ